MPGIVEFPIVVQRAIERFGDTFVTRLWPRWSEIAVGSPIRCGASRQHI